MVAIVPRDCPIPARAGVASGRPVRGAHLQSVARAINYMRGYGQVVLPAMRLDPAIPAATTYTYSAIMLVKPWTRHLVWHLRFRVDTGIAFVTFTEPSGGTYAVTVLPTEPADRVIHTGGFHVEALSGAPSWVYLGEPRAFTIASSASSTADVYVDAIACYALPRETLELDADDYGIDAHTLAPGLPIFDDDYYSIGALARAMEAGEDTTTSGYATRALFAWARPQGQGLSVLGTKWTPVFDEGPCIQPHHRFRAETIRQVYCNVTGVVDTPGDTLEVRFTAASGDTVTETDASTTSGSWGFPSILDVYAEDLSTADGRRSATDEIITIEVRCTGAGTQQAYLEGLSIIDSNL
jgi:hypothetical protein